MLLCMFSRRPATTRRSRGGSAEHQQVVCHNPQAYPPLHPRGSPIAATPEAVTALQGADSPLASRPTSQRATEPALPFLLLGTFGCAGEDYPLDAQLHCGQFVLPRGKARVRHGQPRGSTEELTVPLQRWRPQILVVDARRADLVVSDELALGFLDLHELSELRGLDRLPLPNRLGMWLEEAQHLAGVVGVSREDSGARLPDHAPDDVHRLSDLVHQRGPDPAHPALDRLHRRLGLSHHGPRDAQDLAVQLLQPRPGLLLDQLPAPLCEL